MRHTDREYTDRQTYQHTSQWYIILAIEIKRKVNFIGSVSHKLKRQFDIYTIVCSGGFKSGEWPKAVRLLIKIRSVPLLDKLIHDQDSDQAVRLFDLKLNSAPDCLVSGSRIRTIDRAIRSFDLTPGQTAWSVAASIGQWPGCSIVIRTVCLLQWLHNYAP